jgi:CBS domain-containing protein
VARLAAIMVTHGIHAVVLPSPERVVPLVATDLDVVRAALERPGARASEIAREPLACIESDAPLERAVATMAERYVAHLLVTDPSSGAATGVTSSFDVAVVIGGLQPRLARMLVPGPARPSPSARTLREALVHDVMHVGVTSCPADVRLAAVARSMAEQRVHCIAITGIERPGQHLTWGLIDDMDLILAAHRGALGEPAATIAATEPVAVEEGDSLEHAATLMIEHDTRHVVVVGTSGLPSGIVSTRDVAAILAANA